MVAPSRARELKLRFSVYNNACVSVAPSRARELKRRSYGCYDSMFEVAPSRARELKPIVPVPNIINVQSRPHGRVS